MLVVLQTKTISSLSCKVQNRISNEALSKINDVIVTKKDRKSHEKKTRVQASDEVPSVVLGPEYYLGAGFLVFATFLVVQCCLAVNQRNKGRRDL